MTGAPIATAVVALDPGGGQPLHRQLYDGLREAILHGRLALGARLPSSRQFALEHGVSRNTVALAYDQLRAEGYVRGAERSGTFVSLSLPDPAVSRRRPSPRPPTRRPARPLSARGTRLATLAGQTPQPSPIAPFRSGLPALDRFPRDLWARLTHRAWRDPSTPLGYADPSGHPALREAIAEYVSAARGARCTPAQVIVTNGSQQAIDLAARALLDPGDRVWVEDPGYLGSRAAVAGFDAQVVPVPLDREGLDVAAGIRRAADARLAIVAPSHQYPTGVTMSVGRRLALLDWARTADAWVLEDDYDSEFRYGTHPLPCLQGLDGDGRVVYVGTFSKTLTPALRLGYLIVPEALAGAFAALRHITDRHSATVDQAVLAAFIREGHFARHVRRMRKLYAERQAVLLALAGERLAGLLELQPAEAGLHVLGWLPPGVDDAAVARAGADAGLVLMALSRYATERPARGALMLGYAAFDGTRLMEGIEALRRVLLAMPPQRGAVTPAESPRRSVVA